MEENGSKERHSHRLHWFSLVILGISVFAVDAFHNTRFVRLEQQIHDLQHRIDVSCRGRNAVESQAGTIESTLSTDESHFQHLEIRTAEELWLSYEQASQRVVSSPSDITSKLQAASALNAYMRVMTDGNTVTVYGPGDTPLNREIWAEYAPQSVKMHKQLLSSRESYDLAAYPTVLADYIESFSSLSSAKGIALAAVSGDAVIFLRNVNKLQEQYPDHDNGVAFIFSTAFYLAAPWPVRSPRMAVKMIQQALAVQDRCRRNLYYAGAAYLALGDKATAVDFFQRAIDAPVMGQSEMDISGALLREAKRGLEKAKES